MKKKIVSLIVAACMALTLLPTAALAVPAGTTAARLATVDGIVSTVDANYLTIQLVDEQGKINRYTSVTLKYAGADPMLLGVVVSFVYKDVDGNGSFDAAVDKLLALADNPVRNAANIFVEFTKDDVVTESAPGKMKIGDVIAEDAYGNIFGKINARVVNGSNVSYSDATNEATTKALLNITGNNAADMVRIVRLSDNGKYTAVIIFEWAYGKVTVDNDKITGIGGYSISTKAEDKEIAVGSDTVAAGDYAAALYSNVSKNYLIKKLPQAEGKLTEVNAADGYAVIGGTTYEAVDAAAIDFSSLSLDTEYVVTLDVSGKYAYDITAKPASGRYALILGLDGAAFSDKTAASEKSAAFDAELLLPDGSKVSRSFTLAGDGKAGAYTANTDADRMLALVTSGAATDVDDLASAPALRNDVYIVDYDVDSSGIYNIKEPAAGLAAADTGDATYDSAAARVKIGATDYTVTASTVIFVERSDGSYSVVAANQLDNTFTAIPTVKYAYALKGTTELAVVILRTTKP